VVSMLTLFDDPASTCYEELFPPRGMHGRIGTFVGDPSRPPRDEKGGAQGTGQTGLLRAVLDCVLGGGKPGEAGGAETRFELSATTIGLRDLHPPGTRFPRFQGKAARPGSVEGVPAARFSPPRIGGGRGTVGGQAPAFLKPRPIFFRSHFANQWTGGADEKGDGAPTAAKPIG